MSGHELWHITVLVVTLLAGAALAIVLLAPLVFESTPEGVRRARPFALALGLVAVALLIAEWLGVHGG
ncbi:MAG TPA: hypothetical protein VEV82_08765 [Actinomycetota bacterium]|nr:hypothetical protein [Actinomycetota bacterium]